MQSKMIQTEEAMVAALTQLENERDDARKEGIRLQGMLDRAGEEIEEMKRIIETMKAAHQEVSDAAVTLQGKHDEMERKAKTMEERLSVLAGERESAEERMGDMEEQISQFRALEPRMLNLIAEKNKAEETMFQAKQKALGAEKAFNDIHIPLKAKVEKQEREIESLQKQVHDLNLVNSRNKSHVSGLERKTQDFKRTLEADPRCHMCIAILT